MTSILWIAIALLAGMLAPAEAYNGSVAVAYPVEGIAVDGDLSDWPAHIQTYPILLPESGVPPRDEEDFRAFFQVGYNEAENAFYIGLEVEDESMVIDGNEGTWNTHDGCEIFFYSGDALDAAIGQYAVWGDQRRFDEIGTPERVELALQRSDNKHRYEWKLYFGTQGPLELGPEMEFGFDIVANDKDEDDSMSWMAWGKGIGKNGNLNRMGQVILLASDSTVEQLVGTFFTTQKATLLTVEETRISTSYQMFFTGILLAFTVVHFLLFVFYPQMRANLYYALFTSTIAACIFFGFQWEVGAEGGLLFVMLLTLALFLEGTMGLLFLYSLFYQELPGRWWMFLVVLVCNAVFTGLVARGQIDLGDVTNIGFVMIWPLSIMIMLAVFGETIRLVIESMRQKKEGAWIVGLGFGALIVANTRLIFIFIVGQFELDSGPGDSGLLSVGGIDVSMILGLLFPLVAMSINLARSFARISKDLEVRLEQVQELSVRTQEQNQALEQANAQVQEANRLKSDFLARMSHDLRTPMNAVIGYTRILLRRLRGTIDERQYRNLENVQLSANNLLTLINDILDLSKIESGRMEVNPEEVDLQQMIDECIASVQSLVKPGVVVNQNMDGCAALRTDSDRLRRVLMNLLSNAVKFTEEGSITVSLRAHQGGGVEMAVADTGIGIPPEDLPHIFDEFRQVDGVTKAQEGTGLGLSIARKSVELIEGTIAAESLIGKGTTFTLRIADYKGE